MSEKKSDGSQSKMHNVFDDKGKKIGTIFAESEEKGLALAKERNPLASRVGDFVHATPKVVEGGKQKSADDASAEGVGSEADKKSKKEK